MKKNSFTGKILLYSVLISGAAVFLLPLIWMIATSLKPLDQAMTSPPTFVPYRSFVTVEDNGVEVKERNEVTVPTVELQRISDGKQFFVGRNDRMLQLDSSAKKGTYAEEPVRVVMIADATKADPWVVVREVTAPTDKVHKSNSEKEEAEAANEWLVKKSSITHTVAPRWDNYQKSIDAMGKDSDGNRYFMRYLSNTMILCVLTVIGSVVSCSLVAYGFSRIKWAGRDKLFIVVLATMMIPFPVVMVPLYSLFKQLGWIGTLQPLWVPTFFAGAFNVFLLRQFFMSIPKDLSDAAKVDGCSEFRIYWQIILPLAKPALMVVGLFQFMATWNDFLGPLLYLTSQEDFTLALGLQFFQSKHGGTEWHYLMAASSMVVLPVIVLFFFTQKTFIEGISMSGLKG